MPNLMNNSEKSPTSSHPAFIVGPIITWDPEVYAQKYLGKNAILYTLCKIETYWLHPVDLLMNIIFSL